MLPPDMSHITITDSMSTRAPLLASRSLDKPAPTRIQLRRTFAKLGIAQTSRADSIIHRRKHANTTAYPVQAGRTETFIKAAKRRWKSHPKCKPDQFDDDTYFPYLLARTDGVALCQISSATISYPRRNVVVLEGTAAMVPLSMNRKLSRLAELDTNSGPRRQWSLVPMRSARNMLGR